MLTRFGGVGVAARRGDDGGGPEDKSSERLHEREGRFNEMEHAGVFPIWRTEKREGDDPDTEWA